MRPTALRPTPPARPPSRSVARWLAAALALSCAATAAKQEAPPDPLAGTERERGFVDFHRGDDDGRLLVGVHALNEPFLFVTSLPGALGSNDVGLDRAQLGEPRLVEFRRAGKKLLLVQKNTKFVANSADPDERLAATDAFAEAVVFAGAIVRGGKAGPWVVDLAPLVLADEHGVAARLKATQQGDYRLDADRSAALPQAAKVFPDNAEFEALLTFVGDGAGPHVQQVAADPKRVTLRQHVSFVRLPAAGYAPRAFHPASGAWSVGAFDFAQPLERSLEVRWQPRFRLDKVDPAAAKSRVEKPIVFYLDPGTPEPVRSALLEGGNWWAAAFEAAGYLDAFRVELLPEGVDPLDVRYNTVTWAHRATRGWSYGYGLTDPRTGEIIKGAVTLGSQRVRQDQLIAEALLAPYACNRATSTGAAAPANCANPELVEQARAMALARLRQLSAHEIGHALGFAHNFAASRHGNGSVLDYPHPLIVPDADGDPTLAEPYGVGVGPWDVYLVKHGYATFGGDEAAALAALRREIAAAGYDYVSDADARAPGDAHPDGLLWDFGPDTLATYDRLLALRRRALERFDVAVLPPDRQLGELEARLVPVYLLHRYQTEAVARLVGGARYDYGLAGDTEAGSEPVDVARQHAAIARLMAAISAESLALPDNVLAAMTPPSSEFARTREYFAGRGGPTFDPVAAVESGTALVLGFLLDPARLNRAAWQHERAAASPGAGEILQQVYRRTWGEAGGDAVRSARNFVALDAVVAAIESGKLNPAVLAEARGALRRWQTTLASAPAADFARREAADWLQRYLADAGSVKIRPLPALPPGAPI